MIESTPKICDPHGWPHGGRKLRSRAMTRAPLFLGEPGFPRTRILNRADAAESVMQSDERAIPKRGWSVPGV